MISHIIGSHSTFHSENCKACCVSKLTGTSQVIREVFAQVNWYSFYRPTKELRAESSLPLWMMWMYLWHRKLEFYPFDSILGHEGAEVALNSKTKILFYREISVKVYHLKGEVHCQNCLSFFAGIKQTTKNDEYFQKRSKFPVFRELFRFGFSIFPLCNVTKGKFHTGVP